MKKGNLVLAAICAVTGIGIIAVASGYPTAADYGTGVPGPGLWPIVISIVLLACTAILLFRTLKMDPEKNTKIELWTTGTRRVYLTMAIPVVLDLECLQSLKCLQMFSCKHIGKSGMKK